MSGDHDSITRTIRTPSADQFGPLQRAGQVLIVIGALLSLAALWRDADRFAFGYLWGFTFVWTLVLGSLFFVVLHHVTHSVWSVVVRRIGEVFAGMMPLVTVLMIPVFVFAWFSHTFALYPWTNAELVHGDHVLEGKAVYLNVPFFILRGLFFAGIWVLFARLFVGLSLRQDNGELGGDATLRMRKWSPLFMLLFAFTVTFASFDWLMSLDPHWFSTIYGVYVFGGMAATGLAAITLAVVWLRASGWLGEGVVRPDHLYNLGALLFTFTCFWAYIAFSQFMLIWYGSIPEETVYFVARTRHGWLEISTALALLRFGAPFLLLLSRPAKMNPRRLVVVSVLILLGQLLDLFWLIMPHLHVAAPRLGWQELAPVVLLFGISMLFLRKFLVRAPLVALRDPLLRESLEFHL